MKTRSCFSVSTAARRASSRRRTSIGWRPERGLPFVAAAAAAEDPYDAVPHAGRRLSRSAKASTFARSSRITSQPDEIADGGEDRHHRLRSPGERGASSDGTTCRRRARISKARSPRFAGMSKHWPRSSMAIADAEGRRAAPSLAAFVGYFLRLGTFGFGGPIALAGYMQRDLVEDARLGHEGRVRERARARAARPRSARRAARDLPRLGAGRHPRRDARRDRVRPAVVPDGHRRSPSRTSASAAWPGCRRRSTASARRSSPSSCAARTSSCG